MEQKSDQRPVTKVKKEMRRWATSSAGSRFVITVKVAECPRTMPPRWTVRR